MSISMNIQLPANRAETILFAVLDLRIIQSA